jgi:hypothetical protein
MNPKKLSSSLRSIHENFFLLGFFVVSIGSFGAGIWISLSANHMTELQHAPIESRHGSETLLPLLETPEGWPLLNPLPSPQEVWQCEVVVIGGSLGGVAAAAHAMQSGAHTCLIELTPWLGGQISSQGVSAIDESLVMRDRQNFSSSWIQFKHQIESQWIQLPPWTGIQDPISVAQFNACWVGDLCFPPLAGAQAAEDFLEQASQRSPGSRWQTSVAFKGAEFDSTGTQITAIYAVSRIPRQSSYIPSGRLSKELHDWYGWSSSQEFTKIPLRLQGIPGRPFVVIDATDTGELVGWAGIPHRLGSEGRETTQEIHAAPADNPECTQAFTFPFHLAIWDDQSQVLAQLETLETGWSKKEHQQQFDLENFPVFSGRSFFHYRRIISHTKNDPFKGIPAPKDITSVNWNRGNDWGFMNPPLIMTQDTITQSGQRQNWLGGLNYSALKDAENHALLFGEWLMKTQSRPNFPLTYLSGSDSLMGTKSGLSLYPYIREGRRILGRSAYGQPEFFIREQDIRLNLSGRRDFSTSAVAITHYAIDIHGCRYRNWEPSLSAQSAPAEEYAVQPIFIPLESLIPQRVNNLLIGGKGIAVSHIVNGATRTHYGEWTIGSAAGSLAGWVVQHPETLVSDLTRYPRHSLKAYLKQQGIRLHW